MPELHTELAAFFKSIESSLLEDAERTEKNKTLLKKSKEKEKGLSKAWFPDEARRREISKALFSISLFLTTLITFGFNWVLITWGGLGEILVPKFYLTFWPKVSFKLAWGILHNFKIAESVITTYTTVSLAQGVLLMQQLSSLMGHEGFLDKIGNIIEGCFKKETK